MIKQLVSTVLACCAGGIDPAAEISPPLWSRVKPLFEAIRAEISEQLGADFLLTFDENVSGLNWSEDWCDTISPLAVALETNPKLLHVLQRHLAHLAEFGRLLPHVGTAQLAVPAPTLTQEINELRHGKLLEAPPRNPNAQILVVLSFRCGLGATHRKRNLFACIRALARQTIDRRQFFTIAVEQDALDYHRNELSPIVDQYVFAQNTGEFNRAWGRNVGVKEGPSCPVVCLFDTDAVVHADFLEVFANRFEMGVNVLVPFDRSLWLDESSSTSVSIHLDSEDPLPDIKSLRGYVLSDIYGLILGCTRRLYFEVGGQDERYRGWGDEDNEFYNNLRMVSVVHTSPQWVYHLFHPRPLMHIEGKRLNATSMEQPRALGGSFGSLPQRDRPNIDTGGEISG